MEGDEEDDEATREIVQDYLIKDLENTLEMIADDELNGTIYRKKYQLDPNRWEGHKKEIRRTIDNYTELFGIDSRTFVDIDGEEKDLTISLKLNWDYYGTRCWLYYDIETDIEASEKAQRYLNEETRNIRAVFRRHSTGWNKTEALLDELGVE